MRTNMNTIAKKPEIKVRNILLCKQCGFKAGARKRVCPGCLRPL